MNDSMKFALAAVLAVGAANVFADTCPTSVDALARTAKEKGWTSEGDLFGFCDPICSAGKSALPLIGKERKENASRCACYCKLKAEESSFKRMNPEKAEKYKEAAKVLSDYAVKNNVAGTVPEKK